MSQDDKKRAVAHAALDWVVPGSIVGVGTGSTANHFIDALATMKDRIAGAVSSSLASERRLLAHGIRVFDLNDITELPVYIDGADEANDRLHLLKGGGGALTREKIVAAVATTFVCVADDSKRVDVLGAFPLPVEVIPMARAYVARRLVALGGRPVLREGFVTDNGNVILDVHDLRITDPVGLETVLDHITGVVTNGLFALRRADVLLVGGVGGVETIGPHPPAPSLIT